MRVRIYVNKRNDHKFLEVHNDGHYHNTVRQYIQSCQGQKPQYTGNRLLNRWRAENLRVLLEDYELIEER